MQSSFLFSLLSLVSKLDGIHRQVEGKLEVFQGQVERKLETFHGQIEGLHQEVVSLSSPQ
jgi:hypothetical protein